MGIVSTLWREEIKHNHIGNLSASAGSFSPRWTLTTYR